MAISHVWPLSDLQLRYDPFLSPIPLPIRVTWGFLPPLFLKKERKRKKKKKKMTIYRKNIYILFLSLSSLHPSLWFVDPKWNPLQHRLTIVRDLDPRLLGNIVVITLIFVKYHWILSPLISINYWTICILFWPWSEEIILIKPT